MRNIVRRSGLAEMLEMIRQQFHAANSKGMILSPSRSAARAAVVECDWMSVAELPPETRAP